MVHTENRIPQILGLDSTDEEVGAMLRATSVPLNNDDPGFFLVGVMPGIEPHAVYEALGRQQVVDGDIYRRPHKLAS